MFFVMAIAGMVCTALAVSGQAITDLKTGYWLGSTPAAQERVKFLGVIAASVAAGLAIVMLAQAFQFGEAIGGDTRPILAAPQASIMKALVEGFMSRQPVAYLLFGAGAMVAVMMEMLGVPALVFALGMYLPLELNLPALVGGILAHYIGKRSEAAGEARGQVMRERAVIIASGFMAGGALGGVFGAALAALLRGTARTSSRPRSSTTTRCRRSCRRSCSRGCVRISGGTRRGRWTRDDREDRRDQARRSRDRRCRRGCRTGACSRRRSTAPSVTFCGRHSASRSGRSWPRSSTAACAN